MVTEHAVLKAPLGSGKTTFIIETAGDCARKGKNIVIAVKTNKLAWEMHDELLKRHGVKAHVLESFGKIFEGDRSEIKCPSYKEIKDELDLGESSDKIRKRFCDSCPLKPQCPYPEIYSKINCPDVRVVIIQHAHLGLAKIKEQLHNKGIDLLVLDEDFTDALWKSKWRDTELVTILEEYKAATSDTRLNEFIDWYSDGGSVPFPPRITSKDLARIKAWLVGAKGESAATKIFEEIKELKEIFAAGHSHSKANGLLHRNELPGTDLVVICDATADIEYLSLILKTKKIRVIGENVTFDYRKENPLHEVVQVIDNRTSVSNLESDMELFKEIVIAIGNEIKRKQYKKALVTTFQKHEQLARTILEEHCPDVLERVIIGHMDVGTNAYADCDAQFLLCSLYQTEEELSKQAHMLRRIENYGRNTSPDALASPYRVEREWRPIKFVEPKGTLRSRIFSRKPIGFHACVDKYGAMVERRLQAKYQQAIRLRFIPDEPRRLYVFGNLGFNSFLVSRVVLLDDLIAEMTSGEMIS